MAGASTTYLREQQGPENSLSEEGDRTQLTLSRRRASICSSWMIGVRSTQRLSAICYQLARLDREILNMCCKVQMEALSAISHGNGGSSGRRDSNRPHTRTPPSNNCTNGHRPRG